MLKFGLFLLRQKVKQKEKILASACLLGENVRFDGKILKITDERIFKWAKEKRFVPICPETMSGLLVPRVPCEIEPGKTAQDVLEGKGKILGQDGRDYTEDYLFGAQASVNLAKRHHVRVAILKQRSPSCGTHQVYDGYFSSNLVDGTGITALLLQQSGVKVFDETQLDEVEALLID